MAAEGKQQQQQQQDQAAAADSGGGAAHCADGGCRPYGSAPMCARCYAEKVAKPMEELEGVLAEIWRVNAGKRAERDRMVVKDSPARGVTTKGSRIRDCC